MTSYYRFVLWEICSCIKIETQGSKLRLSINALSLGLEKKGLNSGGFT